MPVPKNQVATLGQAYDYFMGSAQAAQKGVCPSAASVYMAFAAKAAKQASYLTASGQFNKAEFLADLASADASCKGAVDYAQKTGVSVVPQGTPSAQPKVDPSTGGAAPDVVGAGAGAGFPWWIVLLLGGGALVYYLSTKKKGSSLSKGQHLVQKAKRRRRRRRKR